jgi:hypothetical protein
MTETELEDEAREEQPGILDGIEDMECELVRGEYAKLRVEHERLGIAYWRVCESYRRLRERHAALWWRTWAGKLLLGIAWVTVLYKALRRGKEQA